MKYCVKATNTVLTVMDSPNIDRNQGWNHQLTILFHRKIFHATSLSQRKSSILGIRIWWSTVVGTNSTSHLKRNPDLTQLPAFAQYIYIYNNIYLCIVYVIFILLIYCIFIQLFFAKVSVPVSYFQSIWLMGVIKEVTIHFQVIKRRSLMVTFNAVST